MRKAIDYTGERFGKLSALRRLSPESNVKWVFACDCGSEKAMIVHHARRTQHCGCETVAKRLAVCVKHGMAATQQYKAWAGMIQRCHNPASDAYGDYGDRGIVVCDRWRESYVNFHEDMGDAPSGFTLERIDNDGPYCKENCRWATRKEQQRNKRCNARYTIDGITRCLSEWCELYGIGRNTVCSRLKNGWDIERSLQHPIDGRFRKNKQSKQELVNG